jgi:hypothetical protein
MEALAYPYNYSKLNEGATALTRDVLLTPLSSCTDLQHVPDTWGKYQEYEY